MRPAKLSFLTALMLLTLQGQGLTKVYRVGPGEENTTISAVAMQLAPGDIVELTGDVVDNAVIERSGTQDSPIVIRGVTRLEGDRIVRPRIYNAQPRIAALKIRGNWTRVEGVEFDGSTIVGSLRNIGLVHAGDNLTVINCYFHHFNFKAILSDAESGSISILFCEFDSCGSVAINGKTVDIWSWKEGAVTRVEHCYFRNALGQCHLKTHSTRNIIRYNWFEDSYREILNITDRIGAYAPVRPEGVYPMHSDVVGNVFVQGSSPGRQIRIFSLGGHAYDEPGPEGDINIAHNLFIMSRYGSNPMYVLAHGNLDHVRMYGNVFMSMGGPGGTVYNYEMSWDTPATREFIRRRGSGEPIVEGTNNWVFERAGGIPDSFESTFTGMNPRFVDLLNGDFRPRADSPLAGAGMWPLPPGRMVDLMPEFEPQRGVPVDLVPRSRRRVMPPTIGPFEVAEGLP